MMDKDSGCAKKGFRQEDFASGQIVMVEAAPCRQTSYLHLSTTKIQEQKLLCGRRYKIRKKLLRSVSIYATVYPIMEIDIKYRTRVGSTEDIKIINGIMKTNPCISRYCLSVKFCKMTGWLQPNGATKDMVARGYMLALARAGYIELPEKKQNPANPFVLRKKPCKVDIDRTEVNTNLKELLPLEFVQVRRTELEKLFNSLIGAYHYLGYTQPVGEHLKYIVYAKARPVACLAFSSAARHIGPRDRFIGWDSQTRRKNIHLICYNTRFLVLPWVHIKYLASHILSRITKIISSDWQRLYNHPVYYIETFIDKTRFAGTCYKAAGWVYLGDTKGLGKDSQDKIPNRSIKAIYGYPLTKDFRKVIGKGNL
jgi:hypothetical protein